MVSSPFVRRVYRRLLLLGVASALALTAAAEDSGDALLKRVLDAHGGLERFRALDRWHIVAERNLSGSGQTEHEIYEEYLLKDDRVRTLLIKRRPNEILVFGHDGATGFALVNGRRRSDPEAEEEGYYRAHGEYYLRAIPFKWADPGVVVTYAGSEPGLELLEIRAREGVGRDDGDVWVAAIDGETHRLREARLTHRGSREIVYRYSDYRNVDGLWMPFRLEYFADGSRTGENVIQSIDFEATVSKELFAPETHEPER